MYNIKRFLGLFLIVTMVLSLGTTVSAARNRDLAADNGNVTGSFYRDEDDNYWYEHWYPVEISTDGLLELSLLGDPELSMSVSLYNEDKTNCIADNYGRDKNIKINAALSDGNYYVKVRRSDGEGDYSLKSNFQAQTLGNDSMDNDSFQYAGKFNIDSKVTGHLGFYRNDRRDDTDWYEINVPVEGLLNISLLGDPDLSVGLCLFRNDGSSDITDTYGRDKVLTLSRPLTAGNYYIRVKRNDNYGGYTLSNTFQTFGKTNEAEPNDSFQKSKEMSDGGIFVGTIGSYSNEDTDNKDWYKINVSAGMYLRADLATEETLRANVNIYNVDGGNEMTYSYTSNGGNCKCYKKIESDGIYYICVDSPSGYGRYAVMASLSVNEPKQASSLSVPDDPTAYKDVSIPTSITVESTPTVAKNNNTNYIILQVDNPLMNVDGMPSAIDAGIGTTPIVYNGRTLVPIRAIVEAMGGKVGWDNATSAITLTYKSTTIKLIVDNTTATVNGTSKTLDVAPMVLNGRTLLPIRFITENFGGEVEWEDSTETITLKY